MRPRYADSHENPTHWFRDFLLVVLAALISFAAALALAARYTHGS